MPAYRQRDTCSLPALHANSKMSNRVWKDFWPLPLLKKFFDPRTPMNVVGSLSVDEEQEVPFFFLPFGPFCTFLIFKSMQPQSSYGLNYFAKGKLKSGVLQIFRMERTYSHDLFT